MGGGRKNVHFVIMSAMKKRKQVGKEKKEKENRTTFPSTHMSIPLQPPSPLFLLRHAKGKKEKKERKKLLKPMLTTNKSERKRQKKTEKVEEKENR